MFTDGRKQRKVQPYYDHIVWLLTEDNNKPTIIRPHIVLTDGRQQQQSNHNTTIYCVYWYDHMLSWLTDDINDKSNHNTTTYGLYWLMTKTTNPTIILVWPCIVLTERRYHRQSHATIIHPHIVFNDGRQRHTQPYNDHIVFLLTDDSNTPNIIWPHIVFTDRRQPAPHRVIIAWRQRQTQP
jgi:hypothetical protein